MTTPPFDSAQNWELLAPPAVAEMLQEMPVRWWLSGGAALDQWLGSPVRPRTHTDVSVVGTELAEFVSHLPAGYEAWAQLGDAVVPFAQVTAEDDVQPVLIRDLASEKWVLKVNVEDGTATAWVYKRDPRLQLAWDKAVLDIDGIPTGAPEVQLVWKALRPTPEDDADKDAAVLQLSADARKWYERCILSIHPHSSWAIHVRSPFAPAKASWNRSRATH